MLGPACRLLIIGAGQLPRYLAAMARMLDYRVTVCDPREEYLRTGLGTLGSHGAGGRHA